MTTPSEKECVANTEGNQKQDYQNYGKTHIFFGVEDERGTHPQTPEPTAVASRARVIASNQSNPTQRTNQAVQAACHHQAAGMQADAVPRRQLLNLRGVGVNNHMTYPLK
jgi:hypothetical protein